MALLVDLMGEPAHDLLGFGRRGRSRADDFLEVVPLARHRVDAGVDRHTQCTAGELLDAAPLALAALGRTRHSGTPAGSSHHV
jgi:hypothetical protein